MRHSTVPPIYSRIALDLATRIARGEIKEGTKLSGRSLTASQYRVSPETVRRAFQLLSDMEIVETRKNSGTVVISKSNAAEYVKKFETKADMALLLTKLNKLFDERDALNDRISEMIKQIIDISERFRNSDPLRSYEFHIPIGSPIVGKTIADSMFWQNTGATIVALRQDNKIILSPGPYAIFSEGDTIIASGETDITDRVETFINP